MQISPISTAGYQAQAPVVPAAPAAGASVSSRATSEPGPGPGGAGAANEGASASGPKVSVGVDQASRLTVVRFTDPTTGQLVDQSPPEAVLEGVGAAVAAIQRELLNVR